MVFASSKFHKCPDPQTQNRGHPGEAAGHPGEAAAKGSGCVAPASETLDFVKKLNRINIKETQS